MKKPLKRNGTIEFMRFVFCMLVILYHINNRLEIETTTVFSFFENGKIGVEFFYLVSGWLMAKSSLKYREKPIIQSTKYFMYGKFMGVFPLHFIAYCAGFIMLVFRRMPNLHEKLVMLADTIPNLFFLQKSGIQASRAIITPEWYIAAMLWMMLIIFPLMLKYKEKFTKLACPLIAVIILGYLIHANGKLGGVERFVFNDIVSKPYARAFAEMCGGAFCFEVSGKLASMNFKKADKVFLTVIETVGYIMPVLYSFSKWSEKYELHVFYFLAVAVTLSFSGITYSSKLFNNALSVFLGKASLPLYLAQSVGFTVFFAFPSLFDGVAKRYTALFFLLSTFICAAVMDLIGKPLTKAINNKVWALTNHPERIK